jgi:hypothetical protein
MPTSLLRALVRGQRIDRRVLYVLLALVISLPILIPFPVPQAVVSPQAKAAFDTIEQIAADPVRSKKLVILSTNYEAGTATENQTQTEAIMRHLMRRKLRFAIFCFAYPQGRELTQNVADRLEKQYGYQYGRDYVNWGYRPSDAIVLLLKAAVRDIPGTIKTDVRGTALAQVPVMQGIKTVDDIAAIVEVAPSQTIPLWITYYQRTGKEPIPTIYCPTAVMAKEAYPLLDSGQLQGMLEGLKGAIEYEGLLKEPGFATRASASLSYAHFLIIALIIVGNLGMLAQRRLERER